MHKYKVLSNELISPTVRAVTLECRPGERPLLFEPGQYAAIGLHDRIRPTVMRCFSITASPTNQNILQFSMRVKGRFTTALKRLKSGDAVFVRGPFGGFVLNPLVHKDVVLFAGGIGIAPFISMIRYAAELKLGTRIHLVYSIHDQSDVPFLEEIKKISQSNPQFKVTFITETGESDIFGSNKHETGRLDKNMLTRLGLNFRTQTFFVCGPPAYMKAVINNLRNMGVSDDHILSEAFSQGSHRQTGKLKIWPFSMYAIGGSALITIGFYIVAADLYKTLPKLQSSQSVAQPNTSVSSKDKITSLKPQVDTNISQPTVYENTPQSSSTNTNSSNNASSGTVQINPSPTTVSPSPPQTTVS
jgi:ferredoxin-NADP reductase